MKHCNTLKKQKQKLVDSLWVMLYADDAGIVSQSPEQLRKRIGVIVVVCTAFGLPATFSTKGMLESTATFSVEAACSSERLNDLITVSSTWELTPVGTRYS